MGWLAEYVVRSTKQHGNKVSQSWRLLSWGKLHMVKSGMTSTSKMIKHDTLVESECVSRLLITRALPTAA